MFLMFLVLRLKKYVLNFEVSEVLSCLMCLMFFGRPKKKIGNSKNQMFELLNVGRVLKCCILCRPYRWICIIYT